MCVLNYSGFLCGHSGDEPVAPILCRRQNRLPHEPMCEPLKYNIKLIKAKFCEVCNSCMTEANASWSASKDEWRKQKYLPEPVIQQLIVDRTRSLTDVFAEGIKQGPSHTEHLRLVPTSESMQAEAERLAHRLEMSRAEWNNNILGTVTRVGLVDKSTLEEYEQKKKDLEQKYANQVDKLCTGVLNLVNQLMRISISLEPVDDDWDTYEEVDPVTLSDVYLY
ncbi:hypothetical protein EV127DRAFT_478940 [Xylaria flabelliformis]|nr:hypothetical protein EV127DRAFT_478940 [Xylaria flabelliformis]